MTHSEDVVEKVAKAICAAEFPDVDAAYAWSVQFDAGREVYRRQAVAALDAIDALYEDVTS